MAWGSVWTALALSVCVVGCGGSEDGSGGASGGASGSGGQAGAAGSGGLAGSGGTGGGPEACTAPPRSFWTWDLGVMPPADVQVPATCRAQTAHGYVYVADSAWETDMGQTEVDTIAVAFEDKTPKNPAKGFYNMDVDAFGEPPDVDGDQHVILFYAPMNEFNGFSFDGFFRADDQVAGSKSNLAEMLHMASNGTATDSDYMLGVAAHELVHLITWKYDKQEEGWLDESLAEAAMVNAGYLTDLPAAKAYAKKTATVPLCVKSYSDYGATFSWGTYVYDRFGVEVVKAIAQDSADGRASIEAHLPTGTTFQSLLGEFFVAVLLDQPSVGDGRFGLSSIDISALGSETAGVIDSAPHEQGAVAFGARMLRFTPSGAGTLSLTLASGELSKLVVHSVVFDPAQPGGAKVTAVDTSSAISLTLAAGQVADLVVAIDPGAALADSKSAPTTKFTYTATFTP